MDLAACRHRVFWLLSLSLLLMVYCWASPAAALKWEVPPLREECFYHPIDKGSTVVVQYQVVSGSSRDIDFTVYGPHKEIIHTNLGTTGDNVAFFPSSTGEYRFCYKNKDSNWAEKVVDVHISVNNLEQDKPPEDPLAHSIWRLRKSIDAIRDGQAQFKGRERVQRDLAEATCQWTLMWGLWEAALVLLLAFVQISQLKSMFEAGSLYNVKSSFWTVVQRCQRAVLSLLEGSRRSRRRVNFAE